MATSETEAIKELIKKPEVLATLVNIELVRLGLLPCASARGNPRARFPYRSLFSSAITRQPDVFFDGAKLSQMLEGLSREESRTFRRKFRKVFRKLNENDSFAGRGFGSDRKGPMIVQFIVDKITKKGE